MSSVDPMVDAYQVVVEGRANFGLGGWLPWADGSQDRKFFNRQNAESYAERMTGIPSIFVPYVYRRGTVHPIRCRRSAISGFAWRSGTGPDQPSDIAKRRAAECRAKMNI